ncbi:MAG: hypothetical protein KDH09_04230 [Chrysiogenetes bacterium]|nr:hypothetical protein [Chrysiogenetes bacterium]
MAKRDRQQLAQKTPDWTATRIFWELMDDDRRKAAAVSFWEGDSNDTERQAAEIMLAGHMRFRPQSLRKQKPDQKATYLIRFSKHANMEQAIQSALIAYHFAARRELMKAFLAEWNIENDDGHVTVDEKDYEVPGEDAVRAAFEKLSKEYDKQDALIYLATLGVVMDNAREWSESCWPVLESALAS